MSWMGFLFIIVVFCDQLVTEHNYNKQEAHPTHRETNCNQPCELCDLLHTIRAKDRGVVK